MLRCTGRFGVPMAALALAATSLVCFGSALAQSKTRIWNVAIGTHVSALPPDFIMQACGSNGGPPKLPLNGFQEFARCAIEPETGLREIWFSYDDIEEYFLRAHRIMEDLVDAARPNVLFEQLVIYSLLIDDSGRVQGYRIISDPREKPARRWEADAIAQPLQNVIYGASGWQCTDLPRLDGELPFRGQFTKEICKKESGGQQITLEHRVLLKPGQMHGRPGETLQLNEFDVRVRVEVVSTRMLR